VFAAVMGSSHLRKDCLDQALVCARKAERTADARLRTLYASFAESWAEIAEQVELFEREKLPPKPADIHLPYRRT
jgi:hypothetical protein